MKIVNKLIYGLVTIFFVCSFQSIKAQVKFVASAPETVVKGEKFLLSYSLDKRGDGLILPDIKGLKILFGPATSQSSYVQIINGKSSSHESFAYTYTMIAENEGTFSIPPASIRVGNSNYKSNSLTIKVLPQDKASQQESATTKGGSSVIGSNDVFIRTIPSKTDVYEQQDFNVKFKLYSKLQISRAGNKIEFPEFNNFIVQEIDDNQSRKVNIENYNGRNYYVIDLRNVLLLPQKSGKLTIPKGSIDLVFVAPSSPATTIEDLFNDDIDQEINKTINTSPLNINVKPLPKNQPESFSGGVGDFDFDANLSTTEVNANEGITLKMKISGSGNLKLIKTPNVTYPSTFESYDPVINNNYKVTESGFKGEKTIEVLIIPREPGEYKIPPIEFSYFDIKSNSYKTLKSKEYTINVKKGKSIASTTSNYVNKNEVKIENDIRFIKTQIPEFKKQSQFFIGTLKYWLLYIIPIIILLAIYIINRKRIKENANISLMKNKKANKVALKRLKLAGKFLKEKNKEKFYDEVLRSLWDYFSDKLLIPVSNLQKNNIESSLLEYGIDELLINKFITILQTCEFARYAPSSNENSAMDILYKDTIDAIVDMESKIKKKTL